MSFNRSGSWAAGWEGVPATGHARDAERARALVKISSATASARSCSSVSLVFFQSPFRNHSTVTIAIVTFEIGNAHQRPVAPSDVCVDRT
jgi:hypothetical protein